MPHVVGLVNAMSTYMQWRELTSERIGARKCVVLANESPRAETGSLSGAFTVTKKWSFSVLYYTNKMVISFLNAVL